MARALRHDTDHAQAFNCALLFEGVNDFLRTIPKIHTPTIRRFLIREISIREGDRKLTACNQGKNEINDLCFSVCDLLRGVVDNTRRTLIEGAIDFVELLIAHIAKLLTQEVVAIRVLYTELIQIKHCVKVFSGEIVALHGNTFQSVGGLPLRGCPLPSRTNYITRLVRSCPVLFVAFIFSPHLDYYVFLCF